MASKKDRFKEAISGERSSMSDLVDGIAQEREKRIDSPPASRNQGRQVKEPMARARDSVYNVSSDIKLEDYTDNGNSSGGAGKIIRIISGLVLLLVVVWVLYFIWGTIFGPSYMLAIAGERITPDTAEKWLDQESVSPGAAGEIYIHFQWGKDDLKSDYVRINVYRVAGDGEVEEAILGRRPPSTANYIQFAGPLDAGPYHVFVTDREGNVFTERFLSIR